MKSIICLSFLLALVGSVVGQQTPVTAEASVYGTGVVNIPLPAYPEIARSRGFGGRVTVPVTIDRAGNVVVVGEVDGPYPICRSVTDAPIVALRDAAAAAAKSAKFSSFDDPQTDQLRGTISYEFGGPKPAEGDTATAGLADTGARVTSDGGVKEMRLDRVTKLSVVDEKSTPTVGTRTPGDGKLVSGGVLNGMAASLPKPGYPAAARAVRAGGPVSVQVLIAENGSVHSAAAVAGHPLLRRASEIAACGSSFTPTLLEGTPVKVSGIITYNFVP